MKRREALRSLGAISISCAFYPSILLGDNNLLNQHRIVVSPSEVDTYIQQFAYAIGANHESYLLRSYLRENDLRCTLTDNIRTQNRLLKRLGYRDFLDVYRRCNTIMYIANRAFKRSWRTDTVLMVYNRCDGHLRTKLDEAAIIGVSKSATRIFRESGSRTEAYNYVSPFVNEQDFRGSLYAGYDRSLRYNSNEADIEVDVVRRRGGDRLIKVIGSKGYNRIIDDEYYVNLG
ncbi:MAG: hypothetical protein AAFP77_12435 [Bacteroidota bacterium]